MIILLFWQYETQNDDKPSQYQIINPNDLRLSKKENEVNK